MRLLEPAAACRVMVALLALAYDRACEAELASALDAMLDDWITGELDAAEPFEEYARRVAAAGQRAVDEAGSGRNVLVVSSAGTITLWLAQHLGLDARHWPRLSATMMNASITRCIVGRKGVTIVSINEHLHLSDLNGGIATFR